MKVFHAYVLPHGKSGEGSFTFLLATLKPEGDAVKGSTDLEGL